jgi:hypothetical protein
MTPVKVSADLTILIVDGKARISSPHGKHPLAVSAEVQLWLLENHRHPRKDDVDSWLEMYESQNPIPREKPLSAEAQRDIKHAEKSLFKLLTQRRPDLSKKETEDRVRHIVFGDG